MRKEDSVILVIQITRHGDGQFFTDVDIEGTNNGMGWWREGGSLW